MVLTRIGAPHADASRSADASKTRSAAPGVGRAV